MATITISPDDEIIFKDFRDGNSVQIRVTVPSKEESAYVKGKTVKVVHKDFEGKGKIVSNPLIIGSPKEGEDKTISLIVEKV